MLRATRWYVFNFKCFSVLNISNVKKKENNLFYSLTWHLREVRWWGLSGGVF